MKCPNCGKDMEPGFLQTGGSCDSIRWVSKLMPFGFGSWKKDSVRVSEEAIGVVALPAHICKQCKLLVGDYSQIE